MERALRGVRERSKVAALFHAFRGLIDEHGWKEIMYAPKDGTVFEVVSVGSTGIHEARYLGEDLFILDPDIPDLWPANGTAILFRLKACA